MFCPTYPVLNQCFSVMAALECCYHEDYVYRDEAGQKKTVQRSWVPEDKVSWDVEFKVTLHV